jgi:hypothetical protein
MRLSTHGKAKPKAPDDERAVRTRTPRPTGAPLCTIRVAGSRRTTPGGVLDDAASGGLEDGVQQRRAIVSVREPGSGFGWNNLSNTA